MTAIPPIFAKLPRTIEWREDGLYLLDQTQLPHIVETERQDSVETVWRSIRALKVRGAPAIGVAAAYGLCVGLGPFRGNDAASFLGEAERVAAYLDSARPTAVNLGWALRRMLARARREDGDTGNAIFAALVDEARLIHAEDQKLCLGIGTAGGSLVTNGAGILTHCNAGALATSGIGTATAPLYLAAQDGVKFRVFADETRPLLQGARLTTWELHQAGIDVTLITDSMAASLMQAGDITLAITGADRVAANGDVANKIGTLGVAILASHFSVPFYVAVPSSTIDLDCPTGANIPIEERDGEEVTTFGGDRVAPGGIGVRNPAFDVTPHALVAGLITERGIVRPPFQDNLAAIFGPVGNS